MDNRSSAALNDAVVSFDADDLILVDEHDNEIGHMSKDECHIGDGQLHRAFSLFVFNSEGELLLQQRSKQKHLWPLYWANSCCSHPRHGESMDDAVRRRLYQELGLTSELQFVYKFIYQANYESIGAEHEYCSVYLGKSSDAVNANTNEIADWRFVSLQQLDQELIASPELFTPWLKLEWKELRGGLVDWLKR
ncbi:MAG: isopentenyl-diphosphate Delta-isomerase [Gammaproteobacteria bacterium]|nr:isopentenyl-diphosphate Delta-isomerase [Gammaproteobacteria bacterium]